MVNRRDFLKAAFYSTTALAMPWKCLALGGKTASVTPAKKPNFIFILIDDLGWKDLSCYGSTFYETPNIDKLASQGMRFTDAYAAGPNCSPTRGSILLGKYPARSKLTDWLFNWRRSKLIPPKYLPQLPFEDTTLAEAFKQAGYTTALVGKWHLGRKPSYPENHGFDINIGGTKSGMAASHFYPKWKENVPVDGKPGDYLADRLTDKSLEFIEAHKDKPFFLYFAHYSVHVPLEAKEEMISKYQKKAEDSNLSGKPHYTNERWRKVRTIQDHAVYSAMVQSMDESVGHVMNKLKQLGIEDNTIIIFFSDNGGLSATEGRPTSNAPLRAGKDWLYEGGIRVPLIIKWPGVVKPNTVCIEPVISNDFYPTMLEIAGLPLMPKQHCDGLSLVPLLKQKGSLNRPAIYWHYPHYAGTSPAGAVRAGDYKLLEYFEDNTFELYNLKDDISESHNLIKEMPQKAEELKKMLFDWQKSVDAGMPTVDPNPDPNNEKEFKTWGE